MSLTPDQRTLWLILKSNGGYTLEKSDIEDYPGDDLAIIGQITHRDGSVTLAASVRDSRPSEEIVREQRDEWRL